jgi:hypothetical protein
VTEGRYTVDRIGNADWQIFDTEQMPSPQTYLLFAMPIAFKESNIQFILTVYDATNEQPIFDRELWSAHFYVADTKQYENLATEIIDMFETITLDNPVELAYMFGGCVLSRTVQMPPVPRSH